MAIGRFVHRGRLTTRGQVDSVTLALLAPDGVILEEDGTPILEEDGSYILEEA